MNISKKFSEFGKCYQIFHKNNIRRIGLPKDINEIKSNPLTAMLYFTMFAHERQGANRDYPKFHRVSIIKGLNGNDFSSEVMNNNNYPDIVWDIFKDLTSNKPNEKNTKGSVYEIIKILNEESEPNIIKWLGQKSLAEAHESLLNVKGIAEKISAFVVRDFHFFLNLWDVSENNRYRLQPVDVWLERFSRLCWPNKNWLNNDHDYNANVIIECCENDGIDPIFYNQGAWFVGRHYSELCNFHRITEYDSIDIEKCIFQFDSKRVISAIHTFEKLKLKCDLFIV